ALSLAIWTVASGLHSVATTVSAFVVFRFILGIGEGACFPGVIKGVIEWIPVQKRSLATGIAIGGSAIGAVIAPLMAVYLLDSIGWRLMFLVTPAISLIWIGFWLYYNNKRNSVYKVQQLNVETDKPVKKYSFKAVLKNKNAWTFIGMRM